MKLKILLPNIVLAIFACKGKEDPPAVQQVYLFSSSTQTSSEMSSEAPLSSSITTPIVKYEVGGWTTPAFLEGDEELPTLGGILTRDVADGVVNFSLSKGQTVHVEGWDANIMDKVSSKKKEFYLISTNQGSSSCPTQYYWVMVEKIGMKLSPKIGNCTESYERIFQVGHQIAIEFPAFKKRPAKIVCINSESFQAENCIEE